MPPKGSARTNGFSSDSVLYRDVNLVDGLSLYQVGERMKQVFGTEKAPPLNYAKFHSILEDIRAQHSFRPAEYSSLPISIDPRSDAQHRFLTAVERSGFDLDPVDFRDLYVSLPPGISPKDSKENEEKPLASFASRLAFVLGRLSCCNDPAPNIIVVSHSFELMWPLQSLKLRNPRAKVAIAFFSRFMDYRWRYAGLEVEQQIEFIDLDDYMRELFGMDNDLNDPYRNSAQQRKEDRHGLGKI